MTLSENDFKRADNIFTKTEFKGVEHFLRGGGRKKELTQINCWLAVAHFVSQV